MSESKTFDLIVEKTATQQGLELKNLRWDGESPPNIVIMPGGMMLVRIGRYASPGDRYRYNIATVAELIGGRLEPR